jgi:hypothetical protein
MMCTKRGCADDCFYCDAPVRRHDHDHAPTPRHSGGLDTVVACPGCHNLKDRILFDRWPLALAIMATQELVGLGAIPTADSAARWPSCWDDMSSHARLLWAKMSATIQGGIDIGIRHELDALT